MIDDDGFRPNVGIVLANGQGQVLWARRVGNSGWQFPQGGIQRGETPQEACFRELKEEVGLDASDVRVLGSTRGWLRYRLPEHLLRRGRTPTCIGQKQRWFLLELVSEESKIRLDDCEKPEFDDWIWSSYWYPLNQVIAFKRGVYRKALTELSPMHFQRLRWQERNRS